MTSDEEIRHLVSQRLADCFEQLPLAPAVGTKLASALRDEAIEIQPWSFQQLLTVKEHATKPYNILGLEKPDKAPQVVYYKPIKAAQLFVSVAGGIAGASSPVLVGLAVISALLAVVDVRTAASPSECLLFWILYDTETHGMDRAIAREAFCRELKSYAGIADGDFEPALHALVRLGCLQESMGLIEIADKIIIRLR